MKTSTKIALTASLLGVFALGGLAKTVQASPKQPSVTIMSERSTQVAQASDGDDEKDDAEEQQESTKLQPLAKITPQQAQQAGEAALGGKASSVKLENEDGNLVYAVELGQKEAKVDAGNGRVLYTEDRNQENEKNEASRPRSSIQVTQTDGGDKEGETNDDG
jgi:uncharacterized membrane protein YkoI